MGKRSMGKLESRAVGAFARQRCWTAVELAQAIGTDVGAVLKCVNHLRLLGLPVSQSAVSQSAVSHQQVAQETDGEGMAYRVSDEWYARWQHAGSDGAGERPGAPDATAPNATATDANSDPRDPAARAVEELEFMVEALLRMPKAELRDRFLRRALEGRYITSCGDVTELCLGLSEAATRSLQELLLAAASSRVPVNARVFDSQGKLTMVRLTVHRVVPDPNGIVATEHHSRTLQWYPYDCIVSATLLRGEKGKRADAEELEAFMDDLLSHSSARSSLQHSFTVRYPEGEWVAAHLPPGMRVDETDSAEDRLRVTVLENGPLAARLIASLGGAARAEGPVLPGLVTGIAVGTLAAHRQLVPRAIQASNEAGADGRSTRGERRNVDERSGIQYGGAEYSGIRRSTFRPRASGRQSAQAALDVSESDAIRRQHLPRKGRL